MRGRAHWNHQVLLAIVRSWSRAASGTGHSRGRQRGPIAAV